MYGKRKRSSKGSVLSRKRARWHGGGGPVGFRPEGQLSSSSGDRRNFRPSISSWVGRANQSDRIFIKVRTYNTFTLTSTSGAFGAGTIKLNSLHAPFAAITGTHTNQVIFNLAQLYCRYRVTYAKLSLSLSPLNATQSPLPMFVALSAYDPTFNPVSLTLFNQLLESRLGRGKVSPAINGYTGQPVTLTVKTSPAVVHGTSLLEYKSSTYEGNIAASGSSIADPTQFCNFYLGFQSNDGTTTTVCSVDAYLTQWVELYDRTQYA